MLAEAMVEAVTGAGFADLMQDRVFDALGMNDTTAHQPLSASWSERAAVLHNAAGAPRNRMVFPWRSAGGVYASATDYARAMIVPMRRGKTESGARLLSQAHADLMLTDHRPGKRPLWSRCRAVERRYLQPLRFALERGAHQDVGVTR